MKTLKDVYIKVTKSNVKELNILLKKHIKENDCLLFEGDCIETLYIGFPNGQKKVSLSELKKLIETIPTREEIKRLKKQISAYKMNLRLVNERCKELQSDNERLSDVYFDLGTATNNTIEHLEKENERLKEINEAIQKSKYLWQDESERLHKENAQLKNKKWYKFWK